MGRVDNYEPLNAEIDLAAAAATTEVIAAVAGHRICVDGYIIVAGGAAGNITFTDATGTLSGDMPVAAAGDGFVTPCGSRPWFRARVGEALSIIRSAATSVDGHLAYHLEPAGTRA